MKKIKRFAAILLVVVFVFVISAPKSNADAVTALMFGTAAFAVANAAGFNIYPTGPAAGTFTDYIESSVNKWLGGETIADKIGDAVFSCVSGKLIIPATIYAAIMNFLDNFIEENEIEEGESVKTIAFYAYGLPVYEGVAGKQSIPEYYPYNTVMGDNFEVQRSGTTLRAFWNGQQIASYGQSYSQSNGWCLGTKPNSNTICVCCPSYKTGTSAGNYFAISVQSNLEVKAGIPIEYNPENVSPGYQWEGTADWTSPDTNLDQLMSGLQQDLINNDINIDAEVAEEQPVPTPVPTPFPVDPDTPLQDVPWEGLDDLIGQTEQGVNQQIQSQTQSITNAQEATTEAVESLTDTITQALEVPGAEDLPDFKFDLRELFPFCIPFDIYRLLSSFDAEPIAPHVQLPFVINSIGFSYTLDLDFSAWNPVAQAMRTAELIVYAIALAWATGKVIKW